MAVGDTSAQKSSGYTVRLTCWRTSEPKTAMIILLLLFESEWTFVLSGRSVAKADDCSRLIHHGKSMGETSELNRCRRSKIIGEFKQSDIIPQITIVKRWMLELNNTVHQREWSPVLLEWLEPPWPVGVQRWLVDRTNQHSLPMSREEQVSSVDEKLPTNTFKRGIIFVPDDREWGRLKFDSGRSRSVKRSILCEELTYHRHPSRSVPRKPYVRSILFSRYQKSNRPLSRSFYGWSMSHRTSRMRRPDRVEYERENVKTKDPLL